MSISFVIVLICCSTRSWLARSWDGEGNGERPSSLLRPFIFPSRLQEDQQPTYQHNPERMLMRQEEAEVLPRKVLAVGGSITRQFLLKSRTPAIEQGEGSI